MWILNNTTTNIYYLQILHILLNMSDNCVNNENVNTTSLFQQLIKIQYMFLMLVV
jgi:hypothetical protein